MGPEESRFIKQPEKATHVATVGARLEEKPAGADVDGNGNAEPGVLAALEKIQSHIAATQQVLTHLAEDVELAVKRLENLENKVRDLQIAIELLSHSIERTENHARIATEALLRLRAMQDELKEEMKILADAAMAARSDAQEAERRATASEMRVEELLREESRKRDTASPPSQG